MNEPRFVVDTNVLVSAALLPHSVSRLAFDAVRRFGTLLLSEPVIQELNEVLRRRRFDRYGSIETRLEFLTELIASSEIIEISTPIAACRDPRDNKFLELLVDGKASCLMTGDDDLIALHPFQGVPIVTPRRFLDEILPNLDSSRDLRSSGDSS